MTREAVPGTQPARRSGTQPPGRSGTQPPGRSGTQPPGRSGTQPAPAAVTVEEAVAVTDELVGAFARLVPQLSRSSPVPGEAELAEIVASPATVLLVARAGDAIVGSLTLVLFRIPTGVRAWIEDVVVDESVRGRGVGEVLSSEALRRAVAAGARTVDLTSRPSREAANRLYRRLGFELRDTNVYRWAPGGG